MLLKLNLRVFHILGVSVLLRLNLEGCSIYWKPPMKIDVLVLFMDQGITTLFWLIHRSIHAELCGCSTYLNYIVLPLCT